MLESFPIRSREVRNECIYIYTLLFSFPFCYFLLTWSVWMRRVDLHNVMKTIEQTATTNSITVIWFMEYFDSACIYITIQDIYSHFPQIATNKQPTTHS